MDRETMRRVLVDLRVAVDDADAITEDMLRPARRRELGPVLHATNYREARARVLAAHAFLMRLTGDDGGEGGDAGGNGGSAAH